MDWQKPESWPRSLRRVSWMLALAFGFVALSPWWLSAWQDWRQADKAQAQMDAIWLSTEALQRESSEMQANPVVVGMAFMDASEINHLAQQSGLQSTAVSMDRAIPASGAEAMQVQQWPIHLQVAGSWASWLAWLTQWPTAMPGVTLTSLDLRANAQGSLTAQVGLLSPRLLAPPSNAAEPEKHAQATHTRGDPFNLKAWQSAQVLHAQQHPSYALHAAPEMRRVRQALEAFPRQQLRYVGHLSSGAELQALVQVAVGDHQATAASPAVHRVRIGDRLGQDFGQVLLIEKHQIQLRELTTDFKGAWQTRQVAMPLEVSP